MQRRIGIKAIKPCLHNRVVDDTTGIAVRHALKRHPVTLFLIVNPVDERLLNNPAARTIISFGELINLFRQVSRNMRGQNTSTIR